MKGRQTFLWQRRDAETLIATEMSRPALAGLNGHNGRRGVCVGYVWGVGGLNL